MNESKPKLPKSEPPCALRLVKHDKGRKTKKAADPRRVKRILKEHKE